MRISSDILRIVLFTSLFITTSITAVHAQTESSKSQIVSIAKTTCETAALNKYGANSVKSVSDRVKWSSAHNGALVKMKIKPKARRPQKYNCIVDVDAKAFFFKA